MQPEVARPSEDLDNVEPRHDIGGIQLLKPFLCGLHQPAPFFPVHRLMGSPKGRARPRFNLHKHQFPTPPFPAHQVHLSAPAWPEIAP